MRQHQWSDRTTRLQATRRAEALTDKRYEELLKSASGFFAAAEVHSEEERQAAIHEIITLMGQHGLSLEDLC